MSFKLKDGKLYLDKDPNSGLSLDAFRELIMGGYKRVIVSTADEEKFRSTLEGDFDFKRLVEKDENTSFMRLDEFEKYLNNLPRRSAVLLENLDKFVVDNGFEETLSFVYGLRDRAHLEGHVVILTANPTYLSKRELKLFEKEMNELKLRE